NNNNNNNDDDNDGNDKGTDDWTEMTKYLNERLPSDIYVHRIFRTTKKFDPHFLGTSRIYRYVCPTYIFDEQLIADDTLERNFPNLAQYVEPKKPLFRRNPSDVAITSDHNVHCDSITKENNDKDKDKDRDDNDKDNTGKNKHERANANRDEEEKHDEKTEVKEKMELIVVNDIRKQYRLSESKWKELKELCSIYSAGTRNFHNFTTRIHPHEQKAQRQMIDFHIVNNERLVFDGIEFIDFHIHGVSFMYHQIRKMIGFIVCLMHHKHMGVAPLPDESWLTHRGRIIETAFSSKHKMAIPVAPSSGLYLLQVEFEKYNERCEAMNQSYNAIRYDKCEESMNTFIKEQLRPSILRDECCLFNYLCWLEHFKQYFEFEVIEITPELKELLKQNAREFISVGLQTHLPVHLRGEGKALHNREKQEVDKSQFKWSKFKETKRDPKNPSKNEWIDFKKSNSSQNQSS
ncbi:tRNA pseudouridine synthase, partial [Reticulomyxa filosa]